MASKAPSPSSQSLPDDGRVTPRWLAMLALVVLCGLAALEAAFADTALVTPVSGTFLWIMRGIGAVFGLVLGVLGWSGMQGGLFKKGLAILFLPLMAGWLFDGIAWRMADWWYFTGSQAQWETASYPVEWAHNGRKGARDTIRIDPFDTGEETDIPVPYEQYDYAMLHLHETCVTVQQRRSLKGAVEIRTKGRFAWSVEPVDLHPCLAAASRPSG